MREGGTLLKCPACPGTLTPHEIDGVVVDACDGCGGVWLDRDELDQLVTHAARKLRVHGQTRLSQRACPRDGTMMQTLNYPQTLVQAEVCPDCAGLWLDRGEADEIKAVRQHVARQGGLEHYAPVPGAKGRLLALIDAALVALTQPVE